MIYSYNILGFYTDIEHRQFDNTGNQRVLHHFITNDIPDVQVIIPATVSLASYKLLDNSGNQIKTGSASIETATTNDAGSPYSRIIINGETTTGQSDGFYYLEITYDGTKIYSDVFCWTSVVSDYLKIHAESTNMLIGDYELNLSGFDYNVYLEVNGINYENEIAEDGVEKSYGDIPLYVSRRKFNEFTITGYSKTLDFLSGLRVLWANGTVTLTYKGDEFEVYDIENPEVTNKYGDSDILIISLRLKRKDYLRTKNSL
jgi:hypothetical protein